jgi:DNA-directed RNA polymerase specialized sigma24 family protein
MPPPVPEQLSGTIETLYRSESGRVLGDARAPLGDLDLAEEAMHEAFAAALESWLQTGIPDKPRPWLISTARFKASDGMRRRARFHGAQRPCGLYRERQTRGMTEGEQHAMFDTCFEYDDHLRANGHFPAEAALQPPETPDGPYAETKEQLDGIGVLEARDMNHVVQLMAQHPA